MAVPKFLVALALVGVVDAISYMVVAPSIVFYVLEHGGTREQYGLILSAFSFSSFCAKPFVGWWSDVHGFRVPYILCLSISALGGLVYLLASAFQDQVAVGMMLAARLLGGVGAASAALGFAYLAKAVPHEEQTKTNSLLSMTRIVGMTTGPAFNVLLSEIDTTVLGFSIDSLNSVGLVLIGTNLVALLSIYALLDEPASDHTAPKVPHPNGESPIWACFQSLFTLPILVPVFSIFTFNANFQLIETGLAPAANHGLGWTPVGVSSLMGGVSILIFVNMMIVFALSARKVRDEYILLLGASVSAAGYFLVWYLWKWQAATWEFVLPVVVGTSAFPFLAAPTRSVFTKAVDSIDVLEGHHGAMQAVLSMFASVAGFVTPGLVATYVLRVPAEVEASPPHFRELTPYALLSSALSGLIFVGVLAVMFTQGGGAAAAGPTEKADNDETETLPAADESTSLVAAAAPNKVEKKVQFDEACLRKRRYSTEVEVGRRHSVCMMGMVQSSMMDEHKMHEDYKEDDDDDDDMDASDHVADDQAEKIDA